MRDLIDVGYLANLVSMMRADVDGGIWLVDDENEARFYERCASEVAWVFPTPGLAESLLQLVRGRGLEGVVASVNRRRRSARLGEDVFQPSVGDVVSLLAISQSVEVVLGEVCGQAWMRACKRVIGSPQRRAVEIAHVIDWLRRKLRRRPRSGAVEHTFIERCIDWSSMTVDWEKVAAVFDATPSARDTRALAMPDGAAGDLRAILAWNTGRDVVDVLAAATSLFRPRGVPPNLSADGPDLLSKLRVSYDLNELENEQMFWRLRAWERANSAYPLMRRWRSLDLFGAVLDQKYWLGDLNQMASEVLVYGSLAVFQMDLDNFKLVNETCGHTEGDDAIRLYCTIVQQVMGRHGEVYRRGGDEIVVLAPGVEEALARHLAEDLRAKVEQEFATWGAERGLARSPTASIGVAVLGEQRDASEFAGLADRSQKKAKELGKNRVVVNDED
jgi:diguanylate cyclase (GGDEF)-like protein